MRSNKVSEIAFNTPPLHSVLKKGKEIEKKEKEGLVTMVV